MTSSTVDGLNGIYGNGSLNITDVDKKNPVGSSPEVHVLFDGANKVGSDATAFGDIRYQVNGTVTYQVFSDVCRQANTQWRGGRHRGGARKRPRALLPARP